MFLGVAPILCKQSLFRSYFLSMISSELFWETRPRPSHTCFSVLGAKYILKLNDLFKKSAVDGLFSNENCV